MQNKVDYSALTEETLSEISKSGIKPTLLLHACCAPCSSYVIEYLSNFFKITIYFYNPNIYPKDEYYFRLEELSRFIKDFPAGNNIDILPCEYDSHIFEEMSRGMEDLNEGGARCRKCYELRLEKTVNAAKGRFDYFTTTLSISPYKNAAWLNEIGVELSKKYGVNYLFADFKKKNGYKRSIEISKEYDLYRQDYCGCIFSAKQAENRRLEKIGNR